MFVFPIKFASIEHRFSFHFQEACDNDKDHQLYN